MTIYNWYGLLEADLIPSRSLLSMEQLLIRYKEALSSYFDFVPNENFYSFISALTVLELDVSDNMFVQWLSEKGLPTIQKALKQGLPRGEDFCSQLEYERFLLEMEMENGKKGNECLRDCLINIIDYLPERIKNSEDLHVITHKLKKIYLGQWIKKGTHIVMANESVRVRAHSYFRGDMN